MPVQESTPQPKTLNPAEQFEKLMVDEAYYETRKESLTRRFHAGEITLAQFEQESEAVDVLYAYHQRERRGLIERIDDSHRRPSVSKKIGRAVRDALFL